MSSYADIVTIILDGRLAPRHFHSRRGCKPFVTSLHCLAVAPTGQNGSADKGSIGFLAFGDVCAASGDSGPRQASVDLGCCILLIFDDMRMIFCS